MDSALFWLRLGLWRADARHRPKWVVFVFGVRYFILFLDLFFWAYGVKLQASESPTAVGVASFPIASFISKPMLGTLERMISVNGAKVLKDVFNELSETRVAFDKIKHSTAITRWITDHHPERLSEIATTIIEGLSRSPDS